MKASPAPKNSTNASSWPAEPNKPTRPDRTIWRIAFTVCFAVWTIFSIIGIQIKQDLGSAKPQFGLLVGTPILTGSLIRLVLGIWTDQYGGRVVLHAVMLARRWRPSC
jgi:NNP family nitrate/nitrite transporter-like MFS transporter